MLHTDDLFDLTNFDHASLFEVDAPWEAIKMLPAYLRASAIIQVEGGVHPTAIIEGAVTIGKGTVVGPYAIVQGPTIIGADCFIGRSLVRNSLVSTGSVIGHACEVARSILLDGARVPHNSVVPDSVLGRCVNLGGGTYLEVDPIV